jgi:photoactive yellow protein
MEKIDFESVNLAELLPRIPETIRNGLPFGLVKLDLTGKILEYNMAEGDLTGVDPAWAMGRNFFDEVALCTKTQAFYGKFVEGVKRGFLNAVFDFTFDHQDVGTKVKVHMFTMPDSKGNKTVMLLVKRSDKPLVMDAFSNALVQNQPVAREFQDTSPSHTPAVVKPAPNAAPAIQDIVNAVLAAMNMGVNQSAAQNVAPQPVPNAPVPSAPVVSTPVANTSRHQDILKF